MPQPGTAGGPVEPEPAGDASDEPEPSSDAPDEPQPVASASDVGGPGPRSGLPWTSGSNGQHEIHQDEVNDFADWRGAPADVAMVYTDRTRGWKNMIESSWLFGNFNQFEGQLVISQPPYPEGGDMGECADGEYDAQWERFGEVLNERGHSDAIIRVGWEFNGDWMYWSAHDTQQFIDCFRNVSTAIKRTDSDALIEWTVNGKGTVNEVASALYDCDAGISPNAAAEYQAIIAAKRS